MNAQDIYLEPRSSMPTHLCACYQHEWLTRRFFSWTRQWTGARLLGFPRFQGRLARFAITLFSHIGRPTDLPRGLVAEGYILASKSEQSLFRNLSGQVQQKFRTVTICPFDLSQFTENAMIAANPDNTWSTGFTNRTSSQVWPNDLSLNFCMKDTEDPSVPRTEWPAGSYCFFKSKKSPCPYGFNVGSYFNDDDDFFNKNAKEGVLPDGSYGRNTEYKFCCRDDNSPFQPVFLPIEQDFILMPKRGVCQEVYGMISELHYIHFDCENHWYSRCKFSGDAPYGLTFEDGDHQVFFCAYSKLWWHRGSIGHVNDALKLAHKLLSVLIHGGVIPWQIPQRQ